MHRLNYIGSYILLLLILILVALIAWTYYLGTTDVTFKRLLGSEPYTSIEDISLRRYEDSPISPHLFKIKSKNEQKTLDRLAKDCTLKAITKNEIPKEAGEVDIEMVEVAKKSPFLYLSKRYNLKKPNEGRMCLVFRDKKYIYLFINGNLKELK